MRKYSLRTSLLLLAGPVLLTLSGCGAPAKLSEADVDRIAARTAELLQPRVEEAVEEALARRAPATPARREPPTRESPKLTLPPPISPTGQAPRAAAPPSPSPPPSPAAPPTPTVRPPPEDEVVLAEIQGVGTIGLADYERLRDQNERIRTSPVEEGLRELVQFRLMAFAAREAGLPDADPQLQATIQDRLSEFRYEYLIRDTLADLPPITDDALREYYQANEDQFSTRAQLELSEIVLTSEDEAKGLVATVTPDDFAATARRRSRSPSKARGGALGKVSKERVPRDAWEALVKADEGSILGPFPLPGGLHAIYLRGSYTPAQTQELEEVEEQVRQALERERREEVTVELVEKARRIWNVEVHQADPSAVEDPDAVLLTIGAQRITLRDLDTAYEQMDRRRIPTFAGPQGKKLFLDLMANRILLSNLALTDRDFLREREPYVADVERQLLINHFAQNEIYSKIEIDEEQLKARYEQVKDQMFRVPPERSLRARHILVRVGQDASEEAVAEARRKIEAARTRLEAGEDFAAVARDVSEGPTGPQGGDLGAFGPGRMVPAFDKAVQELKSWQITTEPVRTRFGFHLIRREPSEEYVPFVQARAPLENLLRQQAQHAAINELLTSLLEDHPVRTVPENFPETGAGESDAHAGHDHGHEGHEHEGHDHGTGGEDDADASEVPAPSPEEDSGDAEASSDPEEDVDGRDADARAARFRVEDGKVVVEE